MQSKIYNTSTVPLNYFFSPSFFTLGLSFARSDYQKEKKIFSLVFQVLVSTEVWDVNYRTQLSQVKILLTTLERNGVDKVKWVRQSEEWMGCGDRVDIESNGWVL